MRRPDGMVIGLAVLLLAGSVAADNHLLTGEVFSRQAQEVIVPLTTNFRSSISMMVPEGKAVKTGEVVVAFDGSAAQQQLEQQEEAARAEAARAERDIARLEKELAQARFALRQAELDLELATMKADLPEGLIGALEYAENQLAAEQSTKAREDAAALVADKAKALAERREKFALDRKKFEMQQQWWAQQLEAFTIEATQDGFMIYNNHPWTREKFQEGDTVQTSFRIAQVADTADLAVRVWIHGVDRPHIEAGSPVRLWLDAVPEQPFDGVLETISDSGSNRDEWGEGVYFEGIVRFDGATAPRMMPGMSTLVEVRS